MKICGSVPLPMKSDPQLRRTQGDDKDSNLRRPSAPLASERSFYKMKCA